jgi:RNA polymerase subunit RPABC4/transcription elongation factor Spt4
METYKSPGIIIIYWCNGCAGIYTKDRSCPFCGVDNKEIGWVQEYV